MGTDNATATAIGQLFTPAGQADPYPVYRTLLDAGPAHRGPDGACYVVGYEACRRALTDHALGCRPGPGEEASGGRLRATMVMHDPPEHGRLRKAAAWAFTPDRVEGLRPRVERLADRAVDILLARGGGDLVADLAYPLPASVIGEVLGLSAEDALGFRALAAVGPPAGGDEDARAADARLEAAFAVLIDRRRRGEWDDLLGHLVAACDAGRLTQEELISTVMLLYIAGVLTTTSFIANAVLALGAHPGVAEAVRADTALLGGVVEEVLRWDNPVPVVARNVFAPATVGGCDLAPGDRVVVVLAAGNHDPARFPDPARFAPDRARNVPLSFGWGVHRCLGAHLARLEAEVVLGRLLERCNVEVLDTGVPRLPGLMIRGPARLPVRVAPRPAVRR